MLSVATYPGATSRYRTSSNSRWVAPWPRAVGSSTPHRRPSVEGHRPGRVCTATTPLFRRRRRRTDRRPPNLGGATKRAPRFASGRKIPSLRASAPATCPSSTSHRWENPSEPGSLRHASQPEPRSPRGSLPSRSTRCTTTRSSCQTATSWRSARSGASSPSRRAPRPTTTIGL